MRSLGKQGQALSSSGTTWPECLPCWRWPCKKRNAVVSSVEVAKIILTLVDQGICGRISL